MTDIAIKSTLVINDTEIVMHPSGAVSIDTYIELDPENHSESVIATIDTFCGDWFTWVGNFVYKYTKVIDIDLF